MKWAKLLTYDWSSGCLATAYSIEKLFFCNNGVLFRDSTQLLLTLFVAVASLILVKKKNNNKMIIIVIKSYHLLERKVPSNSFGGFSIVRCYERVQLNNDDGNTKENVT